jgi:tetratricopeptide (TPR) repeat protein
MKSVGQMEYFNVPRVFNNHINVLGYLYLYDHKDKAPQLMVWLEANTINNPPATLLRNAVIRAGYMPSLISVNFFKGTRSYRGYFNLNLALAPRSVFHQLMNDYEKILSEIKDPSERNYSLALNNKRRAMFMSKYAFDRRMEQPTAQMGELFDKAISYYRQVPDNYLSENTDFTIIYYGDGVRNRTRTRRQLFVYPDYMEGWFSRPYHSDAFFLYMKEKNLLNDIYKTPEDLEMIHLWISKAFEVWPYFFVTFTNDFPLTTNTLKDVISFVNEHPNGNTFDKNLPAMVVANELFKNGEVDQAMKYYNTIDKATITRSSNRYEYIEKTFFLNQLRQLATNLALTDNQKEAVEIAELFENDYERVYVYMHMTDRTFKNDFDPVAFVYLDSAFANLKSIDFVTARLDCRLDLIELLSRIGGEEINEKALSIIRDMPANDKPDGITSMISGIAWEGNYHRALTSIPHTFTESTDLINCTNIMWFACMARERNDGVAGPWTEVDKLWSYYWDYTNFLPN